MDLLINIITAWIAVGLMVLLLVIYVLRLWIQKAKLPKDGWQRKLNRKLRRPHKWLGVGALVAALIHGLYSSMAILTMNKGTILFAIFILMGLAFMLRKQLKSIMPWMKVHRYLAVASLVFLLLHFIEVGWLVGFDPLVNAVKNDLENFRVDTTTSLGDAQESTSGEAISDIGIGSKGNKEDIQINVESESYSMNDIVISDGVYEGEAVGYQPGLKVSVTVVDNLITEVVVIDHNEVKQQFWGIPVREIPETIVDAQTTEVDIVSGATLTSVGIMSAVEDALSKALNGEVGKTTETEEVAEESLTQVVESTTEADPTTIASETKTQSTTESTTIAETTAELTTIETTTLSKETTVVIIETTVAEPATTTVPATEIVEEKANYSDGVYIGVGNGFNPRLTVEVTIEGGLMTKIEVIRHQEEGKYYWGRPVEEIPATIVATQSTEVDVISGASYTSRGIMKAVENALELALK